MPHFDTPGTNSPVTIHRAAWYKKLVCGADSAVEANRDLGYYERMNWRGHLTALLLAATAFGLHAGEDADFNKARYLHSVQEYRLAVEAARKYLQNHPKSERTGSAQLLLADSYYQ